MSTLPHRFSEKSFRKYEPYITEIAQRFPQAVTINPAQLGLASETVRGRLRDAITSAINNRWEQTTVNYSMLLSADVGGLLISLRPDGLVVAGTKETIKAQTAIPLDSMIEPNGIFDCTTWTSPEEIELLCALAAAKQLKNPIRLNLAKDYAEDLCNRYDIILEYKQNETYLLS
jgi:hypothetical protein